MPHDIGYWICRKYAILEAVLNLSCEGAKRTKKSPKAHTKTDTSSQEKLFGEIQNSFLNEFPLILCPIRIIYGLNFTSAENTRAQAYGVLLYSVFLQF